MDLPPDPAGECRNWLKLPPEVTALILLKLSSVEILTSAQRVCSLWRKLCKEPSMWRSVDMRDPDDKWDNELERMCHDAVDRSCGQLVNINIEGIGTDELLKHIADSSSQLKRLRLVRVYCISDEGLAGVASKLPLLEELVIIYCLFTEDALEAVGRSCPLLKSLKFNSPIPIKGGYDGEALAIAENMSQLRHLQLYRNNLTHEGLQAILDGCPHLESLDIRGCFNLTLAGDLGRRCAQQIKHLRLPGGSDFCEYPWDGDHGYDCDDYDDPNND